MAPLALSLKCQSSRRQPLLETAQEASPLAPRLQDLLLDEAPTRDTHDGPASYNMIN